jgi:hypothetical protein
MLLESANWKQQLAKEEVTTTDLEIWDTKDLLMKSREHSTKSEQ